MKKLLFIFIIGFTSLSFSQEIRLTDPSQRVATPSQAEELNEMVKDFEENTDNAKSKKCKIISKSYNYIAGNGGPQTCTTYQLECEGVSGSVWAVQTYNGTWIWSYPWTAPNGQSVLAVPFPCN